uniref:Myb/SANT-like domain-containing protein n=1 Tax=Fagus sylvatica TaxID=28930 RepID=A0A2N9GU18_FAGSY
MILAMADGDGGIDGESVVMSGIGIDVLVGALAIVIAETNVHEKKEVIFSTTPGEVYLKLFHASLILFPVTVCSACDIHITYSIVGDGGGSAGVSGCEEMDDDSSIIDDSLRANWTPSQDQYFIDLLLDHVRFKRFRKQYNEIKMLVEQSGFKWDETRHMVTADDNVWAEFIKAHHNFRMFRNKVMPYYSDMCIICGNEATMENSTPSCQSHLLEETPAKKNTNGKAVLIDNKDVADNAHKEALRSGGDKKKHHSFGKHEEAFDSGVDKKKHLSSRKKEAALHSGGAKNISEQKRLQPDMPQTFQLSKKARRLHGGMADVLREMAVAVTSLTKKQKQENSISTIYINLFIQQVNTRCSCIRASLLRKHLSSSVLWSFRIMVGREGMKWLLENQSTTTRMLSALLGSSRPRTKSMLKHSKSGRTGRGR